VDGRDDTDRDIYAQRVDDLGAVQWTAGGIAVCAADSLQNQADIASDGAGGAIVTWSDNRGADADICAQRLDGYGVALWTPDGDTVCAAIGDQKSPEIACDQAQGAVIAWADEYTGERRVFVQRVDSTGMVRWTPGGVPASTAAGWQGGHKIMCDGAEGAFITWDTEFEYAPWPVSDVYVQRIDSVGTVLWAPDGVDICTADDDQVSPQIVSDGVGGAIIAWNDARDHIGDIYAQRVDSWGVVQWETDGVPVCLHPDYQGGARIVYGGFGWGTMVAWHDLRPWAHYDIYAQKFTGPPDSSQSTVEPWDSYGHAFVAPGTGTSPDSVTVTLRDALGAPCRLADVEIDLSDCSTLCIDTPDGLSATADTNGIAHIDPRAGGCGVCDVIVRANGVDIRVYSMIRSADWDSLWANGQVDNWDVIYFSRQFQSGSPDPCADYNGDGMVDNVDFHIQSLCWQASNDVTCPNYACEVHPSALDFDTLETGTASEKSFTIRNKGGYPLVGDPSESCSAYRLVSGGGSYNIPAGDSVVVTVSFEPADTGMHACTVNTGSSYCADIPCAGYAIDTIPPPPPEGLSVTYSAGLGNVLSWESSPAEDFVHFNIYRSDRPGLVEPENPDTIWAVVDSTPDATWTDSATPYWQYRYMLTAVDHIDNESDPAFPQTVTGSGKSNPPFKYALYQNVPNPFNPTTVIHYDVPERGGHVTLRVYDVAGRLVRTLVDRQQMEGVKRVTWDGRNTQGSLVSTGVYFYRMTAPGFTKTRKMVLLK
jgi:hypothetical protein